MALWQSGSVLLIPNAGDLHYFFFCCFILFLGDSFWMFYFKEDILIHSDKDTDFVSQSLSSLLHCILDLITAELYTKAPIRPHKLI